jgi:signal transduction histidine kinase
MITKNLFFSLDNPVIFSLLVSIAIIWLIYFFYVKIYKPLQNKHQLEKENLELKNARLMALFAELDPEPLFRFDGNGRIIFTNESGTEILEQLGMNNSAVTDLFPVPTDFNYEKFIENGDAYFSTAKLGEGYYDITVKGLPETGFGQIYCNDITGRKKTEEALENSRSRLRELSVHIQKIQEEEKKKISRELHDNFGQILTSVKMNLELLQERSNQHNLGDQFADINRQLEEARKEIREISYRLRPRVLDDFGLTPALKMLCEDVSKNSGMCGKFNTNLSGRLDPESETNIYRLVQEALNNISKHSGASEFIVQIMEYDDKIIVTVDDDGKGLESKKNNGEPKGGMGMINMYERAFAMDGKFSINSEPGQGTGIIIEIPRDKNHE